MYSTNQDRVYLMPSWRSSPATWQYIDCKTGAVVGYQHGVSAGTDASLTLVRKADCCEVYSEYVPEHRAQSPVRLYIK